MLTDAALRNLKPKSKIYKASDRGGMYVAVSPGGTVTVHDLRRTGSTLLNEIGFSRDQMEKCLVHEDDRGV